MSVKLNSQLEKEFKDLIINDNIMDNIKKFIKDNYDPDEIFDDDQLEEWATNHNFVKPEEVICEFCKGHAVTP